MNDFLIFIAPIIVLLLSIVLAFWAALKDEPIKKEK
ncbi:cytochrome bd oxidase small subunit CydS [Oceanobacillus piezotolerans]